MDSTTCLTATLLASALTGGCDIDDDDSHVELPDGTLVFEARFADPDERWRAGFADYPAGEDEFYELDAGIAVLPSPLDAQAGFRLTGSNHSDDLFMYLSRRFDGLEAGRQYAIEFEVLFASNVPFGCVGIGGAPGESVTVKAGATTIQPASVVDGDGYLRMNIDIGGQSADGADTVAIGDVANSQDCEQPEPVWELVQRTSEATSFTAFADDNGSLWVLFGTDSGFEGVTSLYFRSATITATPM